MRNRNQHPRCHARTVAEIVQDIRITAAALREIFGIERHVAINKAVCLAEEAYGLEMSAIKPLVLRGVPECPPKGANGWQKKSPCTSRGLEKITVCSCPCKGE